MGRCSFFLVRTQNNDGLLAAGVEAEALRAAMTRLEAAVRVKLRQAALTEQDFAERYAPWIGLTSEDDLGKIGTVFRSLDTNNDQVIDSEEIQAIGDWLDMDAVRRKQPVSVREL